jgi:hypothetical protein
MIDVERVERFSGKNYGDVIVLDLYDGAIGITIDTRLQDGGHVAVRRDGDRYDYDDTGLEDSSRLIPFHEDHNGERVQIESYEALDDGDLFVAEVDDDNDLDAGAVIVDTDEGRLRVNQGKGGRIEKRMIGAPPGW